MGDIIGWIGVGFGLLVAPPQLIKILRTKSLNDISIWTYTFLVCALVCYLAHAIYIQAVVFIVAQSIGVILNGVILFLLVRKRWLKIR